MSSQLSEQQLLNSEDQLYSAHLRATGYHFSFVRNLMMVITIAAVIALVWLITAILKFVRDKASPNERSSRRTNEAFMNNVMIRFFYEVFFELIICAFINVTNQDGAGIVWWITSLALIIFTVFTTLAVMSQLFFNGPYVRDTYARSSLLSSFWGVRMLHEDVLRAALATEDKTVASSKKESVQENAPVNASNSNTQTMYNSNVPLNQQLCQAIEVDKKPEMYEGGEEVLTTERNLQTDRGMITAQDNAPEEDDGTASMARFRKEVQLRLKLEDLVDVSQRYETIFDGLKLNTAHNSAVMQPLTFMVRRIIYAALIVFIPHMPQVATIALISMCVLMLAFSLNEKQWKDAEVQNLAIANEAFFYTLLVLVLCSSLLNSTNSVESSYLGWSMIGVVTLAIFVNLTVIAVNACNHCKLLYVRHQNKQAHNAKKNKIAPMSAIEMAAVEKPKAVVAPVPEVIEEVSSMNEESLGIVGLPEPEQPQLINPVESNSIKLAAPAPESFVEKRSIVYPEPQIEEEFNYVQSLAKEICEESPQEKSSEDGDNKSLDLENEMQNIEMSINKSVRTETK